MGKKGRPLKKDSEKKIKFGISIDRHLYDRMKQDNASISKFIQNLVKYYYEEKKL